MTHLSPRPSLVSSVMSCTGRFAPEPIMPEDMMSEASRPSIQSFVLQAFFWAALSDPKSVSAIGVLPAPEAG